MFTLNNETKEKFKKKVHNIDSKDESKVRESIDKEIAILEKKIKKKPSHKIQTLIENSKLLYKILSDDNFPISDSTKKWIIFGLGYLVSDIDLIPDSIPNIGYLDDALIVSWVLNIIDSDVTRFEIYNKAIEISKKGRVIKEFVQGTGEQLIILIPGFIDNITKEKEDTIWLKTLHKISSGNNSPGYSIVNWNISYLEEFHKLIPIIDHKLTLKPSFDYEVSEINWRQLKIDLFNIGLGLKKDLIEIHNANPNKEIIIISMNIGSYIVSSALSSLEKNIINKLFLMGAISTEEEINDTIRGKATNLYNYHSKNDHAIRFISENLEGNIKACGLKFIQANQNILITNIDVSREITRHHDYKYKLAEIINNSSLNNNKP